MSVRVCVCVCVCESVNVCVCAFLGRKYLRVEIVTNVFGRRVGVSQCVSVCFIYICMCMCMYVCVCVYLGSLVALFRQRQSN